MFVPTHELAAEVVGHFREANPALVIVEVEGRNERNCKRYELTKKVGKAGLSGPEGLLRRRDPGGRGR